MKVSNILIKENNNLDLIRIILASAVIFGHGPLLNGPSFFWTDFVTLIFNYTYSAALAVKIFFFISGLVVTNSYFTRRDSFYFIISRIFRILPALFFVLIVSVFVFGPILTKLSIKDFFLNIDNLKYIAKNMIFLTDYHLSGMFTNNYYPNAVNGSLWSLRYEIGCYIVSLIIFLILGDKNKNYLNFTFLIIFIDSIQSSSFLFSFLNNNPDKRLLPLSFAFGSFLAINSTKINLNFKIVFFLAFIYYLFRDTQYAHLILVLFSSVFILYLSSNTFIIKLKPQYDISYGIYLWGFLIQQSIYHFIGRVYVGLHCLLALIISILLALMTHLLIEKPFINIGRKVYDRYKLNFNLVILKVKKII